MTTEILILSVHVIYFKICLMSLWTLCFVLGVIWRHSISSSYVLNRFLFCCHNKYNKESRKRTISSVYMHWLVVNLHLFINSNKCIMLPINVLLYTNGTSSWCFNGSVESDRKRWGLSMHTRQVIFYDSKKRIVKILLLGVILF